MINFSEVFIYSDQPTTCVICGCRTDIILDLTHTNNKTQIHKCPDPICGYEFVLQYDKDFEEYDLKVIANDDDKLEIEIFA